MRMNWQRVGGYHPRCPLRCSTPVTHGPVIGWNRTVPASFSQHSQFPCLLHKPVLFHTPHPTPILVLL